MNDAQPPLDGRSYEKGIDDAAAIVMKRYSALSEKSAMTQSTTGLLDGLLLTHISGILAVLRSEIIALKERQG